jgi:ribA/ribD-fused uncharacterized protein
MSALIKAIALLAEQVTANTKAVAALADRSSVLLPKAAAGAVADTTDAAPKGKRGRKPKSEKEPKAAPPAAEDGVIRFGSASEGMYKEFNSFFRAPFKIGDKDYISLANYFNSQKFAGTDDAFSEDIRTQKNPALTRSKASSVKEHAPRDDWDAAKLTVMRDGLLAKFRSNTALKRMLLATGDAPIEATIEEERPGKGFWSIGEDGAGANHMGKLLMSVRDELAADSADDDEEEAPAPKPTAPAKKAAAKAAPAPKKPAAPAASEDSDSSDDEEEEEEKPKAAPKKATTVAAAKPTAAPAKKPAPAPAPAAAEDSDSSDEEEDDE